MTAEALPRLLAGASPARALSLAEHGRRHGTPAQAGLRGPALIDAVAAAGLRGRGGAAFPTAVKLRAVASRRGRRALVANGAEGEPMSAKDRVLLERMPHLVLDGALLAAEAVGAREIVIAVHASAWSAHEAVRRALAERRDARGVRVEAVPDAFVAGEESALLQSLNGGPAKPTLVPPRPYERGLGRRPTLVSNVETLAHVAQIARRGDAWFRALGTADHPGSMLVTVGGGVGRPGVYEVALGTPVAQIIDAADGRGAAVRAVLVGGYHGTWLTPADAARATLDDAALRAHGARVGAGVVVALPAGACPAAELARVMRWLAGQVAGQCGPCVHGLEALAGAVAELVAGTAGPDALERIERWGSQVEGRGACHHPDGVVRFLRSALAVFAPELEDHRRHGACDACHRPAVLAVPDTGDRLAA
jgi:NADH:ubiquinone oxidoreductase subunit F (NADH-binding)